MICERCGEELHEVSKPSSVHEGISVTGLADVRGRWSCKGGGPHKSKKLEDEEIWKWLDQ